jgi:predicted DNA-binding protein (MmcQ/YjbR family)
MTVEFIQRFCLSFPHATENLQWGDALCFKIAGKLFAVMDLGSVPQRLSFKCDPEEFAELVEREGVAPAPYLGRYKWVAVEGLGVLPMSELKDLLRKSYEMVAAKAKVGKAATKRVRKSRGKAFNRKGRKESR